MGAARTPRIGKYWEGEPDEVSRQGYATHHIQDLQRRLVDNGRVWPFQQLLTTYRSLGVLYDTGVRE